MGGKGNLGWGKGGGGVGGEGDSRYLMKAPPLDIMQPSRTL